MKRRAVVRHVTFGALVTGLVPLTSAGVGAAATGDSPAALCRSTFGERGPGGGPIVGEGPSGDPMSVTIGWEPGDWSDGLREVVTCVSVDGRAVPGLTTSTATPSNSGSLIVNLTLPLGEPGALVCQQSVLVGSGRADGRHRPTSPVCFKLRAAEPPPPTQSAGRTSEGSATPSPVTPPAGPPSRAPKSQPSQPAPGGKAAAPAPGAKAPGNPPAAGSPYPSSTPPARAAFEAALGAARPQVARPVAPGTETSRSDPAAAAATARAAGPRATTLARTGLDNHVPLAGAGGLLALGGAAIVLAEPRRRRLRPAP